ncbi:MAG: hypothetical protein HQ564_05080 [Candidatus Saganbacteria bacterium]|nr:hypothetical protein [Candidatus Saganbacteria bacterium]
MAIPRIAGIKARLQNAGPVKMGLLTGGAMALTTGAMTQCGIDLPDGAVLELGTQVKIMATVFGGFLPGAIIGFFSNALGKGKEARIRADFERLEASDRLDRAAQEAKELSLNEEITQLQSIVDEMGRETLRFLEILEDREMEQIADPDAVPLRDQVGHLGAVLHHVEGLIARATIATSGENRFRGLADERRIELEEVRNLFPEDGGMNPLRIHVIDLQHNYEDAINRIQQLEAGGADPAQAQAMQELRELVAEYEVIVVAVQRLLQTVDGIPIVDQLEDYVREAEANKSIAERASNLEEPTVAYPSPAARDLTVNDQEPGFDASTDRTGVDEPAFVPLPQELEEAETTDESVSLPSGPMPLLIENTPQDVMGAIHDRGNWPSLFENQLVVEKAFHLLDGTEENYVPGVDEERILGAFLAAFLQNIPVGWTEDVELNSLVELIKIEIGGE